MKPRLIFVVTEDWYFCSHRLPLARAALADGFDVTVITRVGDDGERIRREGIRLIPLDMRREKIGLLIEIRTLLSLWRILRQEQPTIVHNVALKPVILGTVAALLSGAKGIVNALAGLGYVFSADDRRVDFLRGLIRVVLRIIFHPSRVHVVVQNSTDKSVIESVGISSDRISLIAGSGVDLQTFKPAKERQDTVVVAFVSRMLWPKGVGEFVDAARLVHKENRQVRFLLVGAPDPANPASLDEATLKSWADEGVVEWLGAVAEEKIPDVWRSAHIGVLPTYYGEGVPKSLLEAGASGKALITTDAPGCRDIVLDGETGLLVPPREPRELAKAILRLAEDSALRVRLGSAARARIEQQFSVEKVVGETLVLYRSILTVT